VRYCGETSHFATYLGGQEHILGAPGDKDKHGQQQQRGGDEEGHGVRVLVAENGRQDDGADGAEVDGEVEDVEVGRQSVGVVGLHLVSAERRHTGLDAAGADRDEEQSGEGSPRRGVKRGEGKARRADDVDAGERSDSGELAEERVSDEAADDGHEVGDGDGVGEDGLGLVVRKVQLVDEVRRQQRAEAVVAEALAELDNEDEDDGEGKVRDAERLLLDRRRAVGSEGTVYRLVVRLRLGHLAGDWRGTAEGTGAGRRSGEKGGEREVRCGG